MKMNRRQLLGGAILAAATLPGCLQGGEADAENGGDEPTTAIPEEPRVDEPPYEVEEQPDDQEAWNELYLCENMPAATDLEFKMVSAPRLTDPLLSATDGDNSGNEYAVRALTSAAEVREVFDVGSDDGGGSGDEEAEEPIDAIDFDAHVLLVVEDGYGSGSIAHHWKRVEATDRGLRLHGCHMVPYLRTADVTARHSVVKVERPNDFQFPRVSLTVSKERRVHFNATEGVVSVDPDG